MADGSLKAPWQLWLVGIFALLFNAIGVFDFLITMAQGSAHQAKAGMTPEQIPHYQAIPGWMTVVWAVGVFGAIGASFLLLRARAAFPVFAVSLAAILVSLHDTYGLTDGGRIMGRDMAITSAVIAALLIGFIAYSRRTSAQGVLR